MAAVETMEGLGASVERVSLPTTKYALACYYIIAPSECSANLALYDGVKYGYSYQDTDQMWEAMERTRQHGFGPEVRRRIMLGTYALSAGYYDAYYLKAQQARTMIRQDFARVFQQVDALVTPTSPVVAFPLGEKDRRPGGDVPDRRLHAYRSTSRVSPAYPYPAGSPRTCRWECSSSDPTFPNRPCYVWATLTSRPPAGTRRGRSFRKTQLCGPGLGLPAGRASTCTSFSKRSPSRSFSTSKS